MGGEVMLVVGVACLLMGFSVCAYLTYKASRLGELQRIVHTQIVQNQRNFEQLVQDQQQLDRQYELLTKLRQQVVSDRKFNELFLFNIKEATITTIRDYKKLSKMLSKVLTEDIDMERLNDLWLGCQLKISTMETDFESVFNQTPQEYLRGPGRIESTDCSMN